MAYIGRVARGSVTYASLTANNKYATDWSGGTAFTATKIGVFVGDAFGSGEHIKLAIYDDSSGSPGDLLGVTPEITGDGARGWFIANLISPVPISASTVYWLAVITDSIMGVNLYTVGGQYKYNSDTYSDGFADSFGSASTSTTGDLIMFASDDVVPGDLSLGGAVVTTSGGTIYSITPRGNATTVNVDIFKNLDSSPVSWVDSATPQDMTGGSSMTITYIHAAIDSGNKIHIVIADTSNIRYRVFSTSTDTWDALSEVIFYYSEGNPNNPGCTISIDSNDKPHVLFVDNVKQAGSAQDNVYYTEKTGASWATPTQIGTRTIKTDVYYRPYITLRNSDYIEAYYYGFTSASANDSHYKTYVTGWSNETVLEAGAAYVPYPEGITATTGGTVYRYWRQDAIPSALFNIHEGTADTGYDTPDTSTIGLASPSLVGTDRYIFYIEYSSNDVHLISNSGSGWTDEGDLQVGTYDHVIAEWAYNNENQSGEINYIFEDSGTIYYDSFDLSAGGGTPVPIVSRRRRIKPILTM